MRNVVLHFTERRDDLRRHGLVKRYVNVIVAEDNRTRQMEGLVVHVEPPLEDGLFETAGEIRDLLILPGLDSVSLRTLCRTPVPVYVCTVEDHGKPQYSNSDLRLLGLGELADIVNDGSEHICPVCGYPYLAEEIKNTDGWSYEICPSCGFQFGVDAEKGITYEAWREAWVKGGMKWWDGGTDHPKNWDPVKQLESLNTSMKGIERS